MPTLSQLQYIIAVEKHRHFGKAAKTCFVSQPSLSLQVQKVESEFGFLIFDRTVKPVSVTPRGKAVIAEARLVVQTYQRMLDKVNHDLSGIQGVFRLSLIPTVLPTLLRLFVRQFCERFHEVLLIIEEKTTDASLQDLREGGLDAAIMATPIAEADMCEQPLYYEPFLFYANKQHTLLMNHTIAVQQLSERDMWLLQDGHCFKNQMKAICSVDDHHPIIPNLDFEGNSLETLRLLIRNGSGYTLFPQLYVDSLPQIEKDQHTRCFQAPVPVREISLVHTKNQWKTEIIDALHQMIRSHLPDTLSLVKQGHVIGVDQESS